MLIFSKEKYLKSTNGLGWVDDCDGMSIDECFPYIIEPEWCIEKTTNFYPLYTKAKHDEGKPKLSLVPPAIIESIARVREYGISIYGDKDNWKKVSKERYFDAMLRHLIECFDDLRSKDKESKLMHLEHAACNLDFILAIIKMEDEKS